MKNPFKKTPPPKPGTLFVISGPSGVGKQAVEDELLQQVPNLWRAVTVTTRSPRPGEVPGVDHYFVSNADFEAKFKNGEFLEYDQHFNTWYGTLEAPVREKLNEGVNVLMEVDVTGGMNVKQKIPDAVLIFLTPPNIEVLEERLQKRGTDSQMSMEMRLKDADREIAIGRQNYGHVVVNDDLQTAVEEVKQVILQHISTLDA